MTGPTDLFVFHLAGQRYALPLAAAQRVVRAVEVTPLPGAPASVLGVIDVQGHVIPVFNLRQRFGSTERELSPDDQFLIARTACRTVALVIDDAYGVVRRERSALSGSDPLIPGHEQFPAMLRLDDGLALIHDLETFLTQDDARSLDEAMSRTE